MIWIAPANAAEPSYPPDSPHIYSRRGRGVDCMDIGFDCGELQRYRVDEPYPEVEVSGRNVKYAAIISGAFGGKGSETTAIAQYSAHRFYLRDYSRAFEAYMYIASVEAIHWRLLGSLVHELGLAPRIASYETSLFWSGSYPAYEYEFDKIIQSDIAGEMAAIEHYEGMIRQIDDSPIQALFRRIIRDEQLHIEILSELYATYK